MRKTPQSEKGFGNEKIHIGSEPVTKKITSKFSSYQALHSFAIAHQKPT